MARFLRLARRAWSFRHDRQALVSGLDRFGIRVPGSGSYRHRSPRVGVLIDRAWGGHVTRSIRELERLAKADGRVGDDAMLALADWHIMHGQPETAVHLLQGSSRRSTEAVGLLLEALSLVDDPDAVTERLLSRRSRSRARRHPHVTWLLANFESDRLQGWNRLLAREGLALVRSADGTLGALTTSPVTPVNGPLVSVIVPMYDAADTIEGAVNSILRQSWTNLEVIVVDDASNDESLARAERLALHDDRVRVIQLPRNVGAYGARNQGLAAARGEFVTVHDADDWAHPERLRIQAQHLLAHSSIPANLTALVRATADLRFTRRGYITNQIVGFNHSSLMFRRSLVHDIGPWDEVRVGADTEFIDRLQAVHGPGSVPRLLPQVPLAVATNRPSSLIHQAATGISSGLLSTGARRYYHLASELWHGSDSFLHSLPHSRVSDVSPFYAPTLVRHRSGPSHYSVVMMSDLALPGGTTASNLAEIAAQERFGLTSGLLHNRNPLYRDTGPHPKFFGAMSERTRLLTAGEDVSCACMVIKYPPTAREIPDVFPHVSVKGRIAAIINQTPFTGYLGERQSVYDLTQCDDEITRAFGQKPLWFCSGPAVLHALHEHHKDDLARIDLAIEEWPEIIDAERWRRDDRPQHRGPVRIGRHGRDDEWKWPSTRTDLLAAYPADPSIEVHILGGADVARQRLGALPKNWRVLPFDAKRPEQWLAELDVFVYFPHADMVEAFGRTILEALAVGVPVICDSRFVDVFGDAVITCAPDDVRTNIDRLMSNDLLYSQQVERGWRVVADRFSFEAHRRRLELLER